MTPIAFAALRRERMSPLRRWLAALDWRAVFLCVFLLALWVVVSSMDMRVDAMLEGLR